MIAWLVAAAMAQQVSSFAKEGVDCGPAYPIAGTTGFSNAHDAIQAYQTAYSATAFAKRTLDLRLADREAPGFLAWDHTQTYGATRTTVYHAKGIGGDNCFPEYYVARRPIDLWSSNVGLGAHYKRIGIFYASSITFAGPVAGDNLIRYGQSLLITPFYAGAFSAFVPLWDLSTSNPATYDLGAAALSLDWIAGVNADLEFADVSAGYTATRGGYLRFAEHTIGLHASATIAPGADYGYVALGGLDRLNLGLLSSSLEKVGLMSFGFLDRPSVSASYGRVPEAVNIPPALETSTPVVRWRTTRLAQQNMAGMFDVDAEYRLAPSPNVQRALFAVHSPFYHPTRDSSSEEQTTLWLAQGGIVGIPEHYALGVPAMVKPSFRVGGGVAQGPARATLQILFNDPTQIEMFPFGNDMLGWSFNFGGAF